MPKKTFKENFSYFFDDLMSRGTLSLIGFLAIISLAAIFVLTLILWLADIVPGESIVSLFWLNIFKVLGSGTLSGSKPGQLSFFLSLVVVLSGVFIISLLIGLLTAGIQQKIWALRKGRSLVIEKNHTIILGWSEVIFTIIRSLMESSRNQKRCRIVIMGNKDKVEMEDAIREKIKLARNTKIICRQGDPDKLNDLKIVNILESKSIIILEKNDSKVLKTLLAINNSNKKTGNRKLNIVAMLNERDNLDSGTIAGEGYVNFILNEDFISRLIANTCYQPGLSFIYNDLLNFKGNEIYISQIKELNGKTFKEASFMFEDSAVIGISTPRAVKLNPPQNTIICEKDGIIVISSDDNTVIPSGMVDYGIKGSAITLGKKEYTSPEKILVLGWNNRAKTVIRELRKYISPDSTITVMAKPLDEAGQKDIKRLNISVVIADIINYKKLDQMLKNKYDHIVVLAYDSIDIQEADSITLMALIHIRDIARKNNLDFSLTSEMLDVGNRELAAVARVNDFIISDNVTSLLIAQISENPGLGPVFKDLLNYSGSEIYLRKASGYVDINEQVNFYTVLEAAIRKNELAIGYKKADEIDFMDKNFGIYINPKKSGNIYFSKDDDIIVLAEK